VTGVEVGLGAGSFGTSGVRAGVGPVTGALRDDVGGAGVSMDGVDACGNAPVGDCSDVCVVDVLRFVRKRSSSCARRDARSAPA
jgi:hypothetical protein